VRGGTSIILVTEAKRPGYIFNEGLEASNIQRGAGKATRDQTTCLNLQPRSLTMQERDQEGPWVENSKMEVCHVKEILRDRTGIVLELDG